MKTKVTNTSINTDVYLNGTMEVESKNFKIEMEGNMRVYCDKRGILSIEDADVNKEQLYFRGDKVNYTPLLGRLTTEGYTDLVVELKELNDVDFNCLSPKDYPRLKTIFEVKDIVIWSNLSAEEKILLRMDNVLNNFEGESYHRRLDVCNKIFGFRFDGTEAELAVSKIALDDFIERYTFLKKGNTKFSLILKN